MMVSIVLVDTNPSVVKAFQAVFANHPEVTIVQGSMLDQQVSAWVTPTNSKGSMDGGLDGVIKSHLGQMIETGLQASIKADHGGILQVGHAVTTPAGVNAVPQYVISVPSMVGSNENISGTMNTALACAAAFQAVNMQNETLPGSIRSVALPGLGAGTGRVPPEICAELMWTGYSLFRRRRFDNYGEMRQALEEELGGNLADGVSVPKVALPPSAPDKTSPGEFIPGTFGHIDDLDLDDVGF